MNHVKFDRSGQGNFGFFQIWDFSIFRIFRQCCGMPETYESNLLKLLLTDKKKFLFMKMLVVNILNPYDQNVPQNTFKNLFD